MKLENISKAYAKSILKLCDEAKVDAAKELTKVHQVINDSNDLENLLFLDVFTVDEKREVLNVILEKLKISPTVKNFFNFLLTERRIGIFPFIFKEVIVVDDDKKGFLRGVVEGGTDDFDPTLEKKIKKYLKEQTNKEALLTYRKNEKILAGNKVTFGDLQVDASFRRQLSSFKKSVLNYIDVAKKL